VPVASLAVGATINCTASHTITQADIDAGSFYNQACTDDGTGPAASKCADVTTPATQSPALSITKVATESGFSAVGDVIHYTIQAKNTGNVTLTNVTVTDSQVSNLSCSPSVPVASLAVGATINCTASHTITQADIDAGSFYNQACTDDGANGAASKCADVTTPATQSPVLSIVKTTTFVGKYDAGDTLHYNIKATNIGNVTLHNVVVTDPLVGDLVCTPATPLTLLAPGGEINCTASYAVQAGDLGGSVTNTACADDGNGDGNTGAAAVCDHVTTPGKNQPTIGTTDAFVPQDTIDLSGLGGATTGGNLHVVLRIGGDSCTTGTLAWENTWLNAGNGEYKTANVQPQPSPISADTDAIVRWCSEYSGNADNAARPLSSRGEISKIDFDPVGISGIGGGAIALLVSALWSRRRRQSEE